MKKLKIGIIGVGNIGTAHANAIYNGQIEYAELGALCDCDEKRAEELKKQFSGIPVFVNSTDLIKSGTVDAVIISTPHYFHPVIAREAMEYSLHVLSEKPLGSYTKGISQLVELAKAKDVRFAVMLNQRANKLFKLAKEIVEGGKIGTPKRATWLINNWYRTEEYYQESSWRGTWCGEGGGVLLNQAVHNLDLFQWILGMPTSVLAVCKEGASHDIEVEDEAVIYTEHSNGMKGVFIASTDDYLGTNRLEISATCGRIIIEKGTLTLEMLSCDERLYSRGECEKPQVTTQIFEDEEYNGHHYILENFTKAVLFGEELISPAEDGICQLMLCNGAYLSSWKNEKVSLPLNEDEYIEHLDMRIKSSKVQKCSKNHNLYDAAYKKRWNTNW